MEKHVQVFETNSRLRWRFFVWISRAVVALFLLMLPVVFLAYTHLKKPTLPLLANESDTIKTVAKLVQPRSMHPKEFVRYQGFGKYLKARQKISLAANAKELKTERVRAAFFVDWDPQSMYSLQANIDKLNMVIPEWFFIDPNADTLKPKIDADALAVMKKHGVKIVPIINNINETKQAMFDGQMLHRIFHSAAKRERLISDIVKYLQRYKLQGINIDFEELKEESDEPVITFQQELYQRLHEKGLLVTQDVMPENSDYNFTELSKYNDYILLMAYDQHWNGSVPGPLCEQRWIEKQLDVTAREIPENKIILCIAGYGYDWPQNRPATNLTYQQALAMAEETNSKIEFNNDTYNCSFKYTDADSVKHVVYFTDAAGNYNTLRFADTYGTAGTALWRLGSEDERLWTFYHLNLDASGGQKFDYKKLQGLHITTSKPDYIGEGEILNVMSTPQPGKIAIETDTLDNLVSEEKYEELPTRYVIKKYGNVNKQVVLTFDDGPDPEYTPQVLDILRKYKVPACFFVVGVNAESNIPLLRQIFNEGHEIGNHTFTHPNMAAVSAERAKNEMDATRLLIESITGHSTILFRAPYNADSEPTHAEELKPVALSRDDNYYTVGESIDPDDWQPGVTADTIYARTIREYESNPNKGIILFHDAGGNRQATVDALPRIIEYFRKKGIAFTTVSSLLHKTRQDVMPLAQSNLLALNGDVADILYYVQKAFELAFWMAIALGLLRVIMLGVMTWKQGKIARLEQPLLAAPGPAPAVSIIVPAYNESVNAVRTIYNLLQQDYAGLQIIFVDDGSKDNTFQLVYDEFAYHNHVTVVTKPNGGKASALNLGISLAKTDYVVCIDADTQLKQDAVSKLMQYFVTDLPGEGNECEMVGAVAGNVKVGNETTILTKWQAIEYITAQNFDRRAFDLVNGITVVPGAIGAFRKEAIENAGGFTTDTLAEDCDLTIRIIKAGYTVRNCVEAVAVTEAPETFQQFMKQRFRWSYGIMQSFYKHRKACFNAGYKGLGLIALPNILLFQIVLPVLAPFADLMLVVSIIWSSNQPENFHKTLIFYLLFLIVDVLVSLFAFSFENEKPSRLIWLIPQRFVYRQLMYVTLFKALRKAIKGESQKWGTLHRTGNVKQVVATK